MKKLSYLSILLLVLAPFSASAETVVRTGDSVSIGVNQIVENNLYAAAGSVTHSGEIEGDMYVFAGSVTVNGPVREDLTIFAGTAQAHADIGGDVRIVGGDAVIAGAVDGDVFVIGGHLKLLSSASVLGNVYFYGGEAEIEGEVQGEVLGRADKFVINSTIGGADIGASTILIGDGANIRGDLRYQSRNELQRGMQASIDGEVVRVEGEVPEKRTGGNGSLILLLAWFFTSLVAYLLFRSSLERLLRGLKGDPVRAGLIGFAGVIVAPIASIFLLATVIGAFAGVVMLFTTLLFVVLSLILLPILLGGYLLSLYRKNLSIDVWSVIAGMLVLVILTMIPVLGGLLLFAGFVLVFGSLLQRLYGVFRSLS